MAALNRPTEATYEVHENISVDTQGKFFQRDARFVIVLYVSQFT